MTSRPESSLGSLVGEYVPISPEKANRILMVVILIGIGLLVLSPVLWNNRHPAAPAAAFFGLAVLGFGAFAWYRVNVLLRGTKLSLYDQGFVFQTSRSHDQVPYDSIARFFDLTTGTFQNGKFVPSSVNYRIELTSGKTIQLSDVVLKVSEAMETIEAAVAERLYPPMLVEFQAGREVAFKRVALSQRGIRVDGKQLDWSEVKHIRLHQGVISVKKNGGMLDWADVELAHEGNTKALLRLLQQCPSKLVD